MCGRFALAVEPEALARFVGLASLPPLEPRYNIAPTQPVLTVLEEHGARVARPLRWGLTVPGVAAPLINARAETVFDKPAFREAFATRRCLVPASGFYEWERGGGRRPWLFRPPDAGLLALAALWEPAGPRGEATVCVLTTAANAAVAPVHDRMPVLLAPADFAAWLDPGPTDPARIAPLLEPAPADSIRAVALDGTVSNVCAEGPACWREAEERQGRLF
jgi:putative SOS response-associated peptidase YedK